MYGNQGNSYQGNRGSGSFNHGNRPQIRFSAKFQEKGFRDNNGRIRVDLFGEEAKDIAEILAKEITSSQLRAFYGEVKAIQNRIEDSEESFEDVLPFIVMLKSKADYKYRNGKSQKIPQTFRDFIFAGVDEVKKQGKKQAFDDFCYLFEAVVGFIYGINGGK